MIVDLKRRAAFCAAHNYWLSKLSEEENYRRFGKWTAPYPHGHNYIVEVTVSGEVDVRTGMVVNITDINREMKARVVDILDGRYLNREVLYFEENAPTVENIAKFVWDVLEPAIPAGAELTGVLVQETDTVCAKLIKERGRTMTTTLTRGYDFSASHRLHSRHLTDDENREIFGKCNNPNGHGHNYVIKVSITGEPSPETGMVFSIDELDKIVDEEVLVPFDHKHLNQDTVEFAEINPTSEMLAIVIWQKLARRLPTHGERRLSSVIVTETARNSFEYRGETTL